MWRVHECVTFLKCAPDLCDDGREHNASSWGQSISAFIVSSYVMNFCQAEAQQSASLMFKYDLQMYWNPRKSQGFTPSTSVLFLRNVPK